MPPLSTLEALERLFADCGGLAYGEDVSQLEHALQCAALAEAAQAPPSLVVAALLHDVGHLLAQEGPPPGAEDRHDIAGAQALKGLFDESVRAPIALHVSAKRWLCWREPDYYEDLSAASKASLKRQGGPFHAPTAARFEEHPRWREAVALRRFDDQAKRQEPAGRSFGDYLPLMRSLLIGGSEGA